MENIIVITILCIGILISGLYLTLSKGLKNLRNDNNFFFEFLVTIMATFLGAFIAIAVTNINTDTLEKQKMIKMLQLSINDMQSIQANLGIYYTNIVDKSDPYGISKHISNNKLQFSNFFDQFLMNDTILNSMTPETFASLINGSNNAKVGLDVLNHRKLDNKQAELYIDIYGKELDYLINIMNSEIKYCNRKSSLKDMVNSQKVFKYELMGIKPEAIEKALQSGKTN